MYMCNSGLIDDGFASVPAGDYTRMDLSFTELLMVVIPFPVRGDILFFRRHTY